MHVSLDENVHASNAVQLRFFVLVRSPVAHQGKIFAICPELLVSFRKYSALIETRSQSQTTLTFYPRIVIKFSFDVPSVFVSMEPNVCQDLSEKAHLSADRTVILGTRISLS